MRFLLNFFISKRFIILVITSNIFYLLVSCSDTTSPKGNILPGLYVLNEGFYGVENTSELDIVSSAIDSSVERKVYLNTTGEPLGDTPNDMIVQNNKLYLILNNSRLMKVLDLDKKEKSGELSFGENAPREIALTGDNMAFVTAYDSLLFKIDLNSLTIKDTITVGQKPEAVIYAGGFIFAACGGWGSDNRVFVINPQDGRIVKILHASPNVISLASDGQTVYAGAIPVWGSPVTNPFLFSYSMTSLVKTDSVAIEGGVSHLQVMGTELFLLNSALKKIDKSDLHGNMSTVAAESDFVIYGFLIKEDGNIWTAEYSLLEYTDPGRVVKRNREGIAQSSYEVGIFPRVMLEINE